MTLLDLFDSRDKKKRLSHIRNLIALASADGHLDEVELKLISRISWKVGLSTNEFERIIKRPNSVDFVIPSSFNERVEQLYDMVLVMMIDTEIHENEIALCKLTAIKLGFKHQIVDKMVNDIVEMIAKGLVFEMVMSNLEDKYNL